MSDDKSIRQLTDEFTDALGLSRIDFPKPIDCVVRMPQVRGPQETIPAQSPDDQLAREAAAEIEREQGYTACAEARLRGAYDGDTEHMIALAAIRKSRERGEAKNLPASIK